MILNSQLFQNRPNNEKFPPQLMRRFEVSFNQPKARFSAVAVRDVKAQHIGKLVSVKGKNLTQNLGSSSADKFHGFLQKFQVS